MQLWQIAVLGAVAYVLIAGIILAVCLATSTGDRALAAQTEQLPASDDSSSPSDERAA